MTSRHGKRWWVIGLLVTLLVAGVLSAWASPEPDGLNRVAINQGFAEDEREHTASNSPLAGYEAIGLDGALAGGAAGVVGVVAVLGLGTGGLLLLVRRRRGRPGAADVGSRGDTGGSRPGGG